MRAADSCKANTKYSKPHHYHLPHTHTYTRQCCLTVNTPNFCFHLVFSFRESGKTTYLIIRLNVHNELKSAVYVNTNYKLVLLCLCASPCGLYSLKFNARQIHTGHYDFYRNTYNELNVKHIANVQFIKGS